MDVWRNLGQLKAAVQEGVKEFSNVAINEVRTGVQTIQVLTQRSEVDGW